MKPFKLMDTHVALQTVTCKLLLLLFAMYYYLPCASAITRTGEIRQIKMRSRRITTISPSASETVIPPTVAQSLNVHMNGIREMDEETRKKRQLFREDIPHHRPLTGLSGNTDALNQGFPLPGRFSTNPGYGGGNTNNLHEENPGGYEQGPHIPTVVHDHHTVIYEHHPPSGNNGHQQPDHPTMEHGNEIVHQYPVEIGQYIQLDHDHDHDIKSGGGPSSVNVGIHPSQLDLSPHHQSKPGLPADLIVTEPGAGGHQHGHEEEQIVPYQVGHSPNGEHYYSFSAGNPYDHYHGHGPVGPYRGVRPSKLVHLLKTWPLLFTHKMRRTFWPYRRYRPKIKHHHHYY